MLTEDGPGAAESQTSGPASSVETAGILGLLAFWPFRGGCVRWTEVASVAFPACVQPNAGGRTPDPSQPCTHIRGSQRGMKTTLWLPWQPAISPNSVSWNLCRTFLTKIYANKFTLP